MYKSKLQELCHQRSWNLPEYSTSREGPDHNPRFQATVTVNTLSFHSQNLCRSSKEAQNDAAYVAFLHLSAPSTGSSNVTAELTNNIANKRTFEKERKELDRIPQFNQSAPLNKDDDRSKDMHRLYKNQLQTYAQKQNLLLPTYSCEREGPPHASRFRCKVTIGEQTFESQEFFPTIKEAEHAVAKIALNSLLPDANQEEDCSVYKNLLQELAQKEGFLLPVYTIVRSGEAHMPTFHSTVEVVGKVFRGRDAKTRKQAEMSAAKVAYMSLKEGTSSQTLTPPLPLASQRQQVLDHSSPALSNVNEDLQQDSRQKRRMILNPDSTSEEQTDGREAPRELVISHDFDIKKNGVSLSPPPPKTSTNKVINSSMQPHTGTTMSTSSFNQSPVKTDASFINRMIDGTGVPTSCQRVVVRPHMPGMTFPLGSEIVASDDHWVAVKLVSQTESAENM